MRGLWDWCADGAEKATCSLKAVIKKDGFHLRKVLPVLLMNYLFGATPDVILGLWGAGSLTATVLAEYALWAAASDQENAFSYVEVPVWMRFYQACPAVLHWQAGGPAVTGLWHVGRCGKVRPLYRRLATRLKDACLILVAINRHAVGSVLVWGLSPPHARPARHREAADHQ